MFYKVAVPTSLKVCMLAISWSHFPCLTYRALKNMELAGRLYHYTKVHLKILTTANCSCPLAEAKLLTRRVLSPCSINPAASSEPALSNEQHSRALPTPCCQHRPSSTQPRNQLPRRTLHFGIGSHQTQKSLKLIESTTLPT